MWIISLLSAANKGEYVLSMSVDCVSDASGVNHILDSLQSLLANTQNAIAWLVAVAE